MRVLLDIEIIFKILHKDGNGLEESSVKSLTFWQTKKKQYLSVSGVFKFSVTPRSSHQADDPADPSPLAGNEARSSGYCWGCSKTMTKDVGTRRIPIRAGELRPELTRVPTRPLPRGRCRWWKQTWYQHFISRAFHTDRLISTFY